MFDMTSLISQYFKVKLPNGVELDVNPPKMKVLRKMLSLAKEIKTIGFIDGEAGDMAIGVLSEALATALSNNQQKRKITVEELDDLFDITQLIELFQEYFNWVGEINNSKN